MTADTKAVQAANDFIELYKEDIKVAPIEVVENALYEWFYHNWRDYTEEEEKECFYKELQKQVYKSL